MMTKRKKYIVRQQKMRRKKKERKKNICRNNMTLHTLDTALENYVKRKL